jgi:hypothetical protein
LSVQSFSGFRLQARMLQTSNEPGAKLTVRAVLTEYGLPVEGDRAQVRAEFERPDGTTGVMPLSEEASGTGIYVNDMIAALAGVYRFHVFAQATTLRGREVSREHLLTGAVWDGGDNPPPSGKDEPERGKERLCELLACLLNSNVITPDLEQRLGKLGLNVGGIRRCLKEWCRPT